MNPLKKDLERQNAQEWDEVSEISSVAPSEVIPVPSAEEAPRKPVPSATYGNGLFHHGPRPLATGTSPEKKKPAGEPAQANRPAQVNIGEPQVRTADFVRALYDRGGRYQPAARGRGTSNPQTRYDPNQQRRPNSSPVSFRGRGRGQENRPPPPHIGGGSKKWAEPAALVTTRKAEALEEKRLREAEDNQYKKAPNPKEDFPCIAYYLWPSNKKGQGPHDILGLSLEALDKIRVDNKVFVWTSNDATCLKVCSRIPDETDSRLQAVIHAIRQVIRHRHALSFLAEPTHIAPPPGAAVMTTLVLPITSLQNPRNPLETKGVKLGGEKLSEDKRSEWDDKFPIRVEACRKKFEETMTKALNGLKTYRSWMRMRVRFGHVILENPMKKFVRGKLGWEDFVKMVTSERLKSTLDAKFDDANAVGQLREMILERPGRFRPASGRDRVMLLSDAPFKFTEIVFLDTPAGSLRIEAEIDILTEFEQGEYQVGATRFFNDGERNKRLQLTILDAEQQLDWAIDIVTDNEMDIDKIPDPVLRMIQGSVSTQSRIRHDLMGLPYPEVKLLGYPGTTIKEVVVKSVVEYKMENTDYNVELTLLRTWCGSDTSGLPNLSTTVAMYHDEWDYEMDRLTPTDDDRSWVKPLKTFFGKGVDNEDTDIGSRGVERFIADVTFIQRYLATAKRALEVEQPAQPLRTDSNTEGPHQSTNGPSAARLLASSITEADSPHGDLYSAD